MAAVFPKVVNSKVEALEFCLSLLEKGAGGPDEERRAALQELIEGYRAQEEREKAGINLKTAVGRNFYIPPAL